MDEKRGVGEVNHNFQSETGSPEVIVGHQSEFIRFFAGLSQTSEKC